MILLHNINKLLLDELLPKTHSLIQLSHWYDVSDALRTIIREEGWRALYKGIGPSLLLVIYWPAHLHVDFASAFLVI